MARSLEVNMNELLNMTGSQALEYFENLDEFPELDNLSRISIFPKSYHGNEDTVFGTPAYVIEHNPRTDTWNIIYACSICGEMIDGRVWWNDDNAVCEKHHRG